MAQLVRIIVTLAMTKEPSPAGKRVISKNVKAAIENWRMEQGLSAEDEDASVEEVYEVYAEGEAH